MEDRAILYLVTGIILIVVGIGVLVSTILIFAGNTKVIMAFETRNIKPEDKKKFCIINGLNYLVTVAAFMTVGILLINIKTDTMLFISLGVAVGAILLSFPVLLITLKKYNGRIKNI